MSKFIKVKALESNTPIYADYVIINIDHIAFVADARRFKYTKSNTFIYLNHIEFYQGDWSFPHIGVSESVPEIHEMIKEAQQGTKND